MNVRSSIFEWSSIWGEVTNHFVWPDGGTKNGVHYTTIGVKDGRLTIDMGNEAGTLTPVKDATDKFDADGRATLKFNRDVNQKVTGLTLDAQGMSFEGKKEA